MGISSRLFLARSAVMTVVGGRKVYEDPPQEVRLSEIDAQNKLTRATTPGNARLKYAGVAMRPDKRP